MCAVLNGKNGLVTYLYTATNVEVVPHCSMPFTPNHDLRKEVYLRRESSSASDAQESAQPGAFFLQHHPCLKLTLGAVSASCRVDQETRDIPRRIRRLQSSADHDDTG